MHLSNEQCRKKATCENLETRRSIEHYPVIVNSPGTMMGSTVSTEKIVNLYSLEIEMVSEESYRKYVNSLIVFTLTSIERKLYFSTR